MIPGDMIAAVEAERPEIAANIVAMWGEPECDPYLESLLFGEGREQVSIPVFAALAGLQELHRLLYAPRLVEDAWP